MSRRMLLLVAVMLWFAPVSRVSAAAPAANGAAQPGSPSPATTVATAAPNPAANSTAKSIMPAISNGNR